MPESESVTIADEQAVGDALVDIGGRPQRHFGQQQRIGRHAEHHGPCHFGGGRQGVAQYKIRFDGVVMVVKGILYDSRSREMALLDWSLDPKDGRPHGVSSERTGVIAGVDCHRVTVANAGEFAYSVSAEDRGRRDPAVFARALQRYVELAGR